MSRGHCYRPPIPLSARACVLGKQACQGEGDKNGRCAGEGVITDDVDAIAHRVRQSGTGTVVHPPATTQFGAGAVDAYACTIADPESNLWTFGTYRGAAAR